MQIDIAALAEYAIVDQQGKMSVLGIFTALNAPQFPLVHPRLFICLRINCRAIEAGTQHMIAVRVQDADGKKIAELSGPFAVPTPAPAVAGGPITVQMVFDLVGLTFPKPGQCSVEIAFDQSHQHSVPFMVVAMAPPQPS